MTETSRQREDVRAERLDAHRSRGSLPISGRAIRVIGGIEANAYQDGQCAAVVWLETQVYGGLDPLEALANLSHSLFPLAEHPTTEGDRG